MKMGVDQIRRKREARTGYLRLKGLQRLREECIIAFS
jgi:hypothetical protein